MSHGGDSGAAVGTQAGPPPLYDDLGTHAYRISTDVPLAQAYFDQGLRLYYAFNHQEAIRSFREAQRLDPDCAMCWWGEALAWGPNINLPMDSTSGVMAWSAAREAVARRDRMTPKEQGLIDALAGRYEAVPHADRATLDRAWVDGLIALQGQYPSDVEIAVLLAESRMDLSPWDYWTEQGEPRAWIADALADLQMVMETSANHPGACHFYIHAVEKLYPERAIPCAERLAGLMPGAGHIVHMPGHIYIRVGRYEDAIRANEHAVHADESWIADQQPAAGMYTAGYYPHNYDFMAFAAAMVGRREKAVEAAERMAALIPTEMLGAEGMTFLQHYLTRPIQMYVRFAMWKQLLDAPIPAAEHRHARAMTHYGRGRAMTGLGDLEGARKELAALRALTAELEGVRLEFNGAGQVLRIAAGVLEGRISAAEGDLEGAIELLTSAVELEDQLLYGEPPEWTVPARHDLGAVLLQAGRRAEAAEVFRADLVHFPRNVWSERGLAAATTSGPATPDHSGPASTASGGT